MSSVSRTIRRGIMFRGMNKQQKMLYRREHGGFKDPGKQDKADWLAKQEVVKNQSENNNEKE